MGVSSAVNTSVFDAGLSVFDHMSYSWKKHYFKKYVIFTTNYWVVIFSTIMLMNITQIERRLISTLIFTLMLLFLTKRVDPWWLTVTFVSVGFSFRTKSVFFLYSTFIQSRRQSFGISVYSTLNKNAIWSFKFQRYFEMTASVLQM